MEVFSDSHSNNSHSKLRCLVEEVRACHQQAVDSSAGQARRQVHLAANLKPQAAGFLANNNPKTTHLVKAHLVVKLRPLARSLRADPREVSLDNRRTLEWASNQVLLAKDYRELDSKTPPVVHYLGILSKLQVWAANRKALVVVSTP